MRLGITLPALLLPLVLVLGCAEDPAPPAGPASPGPEPAPETTVSEPEPQGATLAGHASVELRIQRTQTLGGIELVLLPESATEKIMAVRNERWLILASRFKFGDGYNNLDLKRIGVVAVQEAVKTTKADADGNYRFTGVQPGRYVIYGQYKSRYAAGYWLVPVEVHSPDDALTLDLTHENMKEIHNREIRRWQGQ